MVLYALPHNNHPQMNLRERYLVYLLIIEQWIIWIGYLIWTLSYAKLFFIGRLLVFNGRQGRMINAVSCSLKRRELSAMTRKFGRLLIRFSHILIFVWVWYRIGKGQSAMILIALRWIYLGGRCYRIQVGIVSFVFNWLSDLFFYSGLERWANIPNAASSVPGVWANILTFIAGPRACIGFRGVSLIFSCGYIHPSGLCSNIFLESSLSID